MKSKTNVLLGLVIVALVWCASTAFAQTEILTFDDLSPASAGLITNGYGGLQWQNFGYEDGVNVNPGAPPPTVGTRNGIVSPNDAAFNVFGAPASLHVPFSEESFNLDSAYLTAARNDGLQVEVQGFVFHELIYDNTFTVNTAGPMLVHFNYLGVDTVRFISSGGTPNSGNSATQFVMDNLNVTFVPEPSTFVLVGFFAISLILRGLTRSRHLTAAARSSSTMIESHNTVVADASTLPAAVDQFCRSDAALEKHA
jgi:hypothetical protein